MSDRLTDREIEVLDEHSGTRTSNGGATTNVERAHDPSLDLADIPNIGTIREALGNPPDADVQSFLVNTYATQSRDTLVVDWLFDGRDLEPILRLAALERYGGGA